MSFEVKRVDSKRESFGEYQYNIYQHGRLVARYWHDYRGDDHGIEFMNGEKEGWPVGPMIEFITGGGPQPLGLSARAVDYLKSKVGQ